MMEFGALVIASFLLAAIVMAAGTIGADSK